MKEIIKAAKGDNMNQTSISDLVVLLQQELSRGKYVSWGQVSDIAGLIQEYADKKKVA